MKRPNKEDYDFQEPMYIDRFAKDMMAYADYLEAEKEKSIKEKLGQEPAFPPSEWVLGRCGQIDFDPMGMSKRFYAATKAMQGLLPCYMNTGFHDEDEYIIKHVVELSYMSADELLRQENE